MDCQLTGPGDAGRYVADDVMLYDQHRTCRKCGNVEERQIPAEVAAFDERRTWTSRCPKCWRRDFSPSGVAIPPLDRELLAEWSRDPKLSFLSQDEDLMMADVDTLPLLLDFVLRPEVIDSKRATLFSAILVLLFDNIDPSNSERRIDVADTISEFLRNNKWLVDRIDTGYYCGYAREDVCRVIDVATDAT